MDIDVNTSSGILQPALKHKFRVRFNPPTCVLETQILSSQLIYCGRNAVNGTLNITLQQDLATDTIHRFIEHLISPAQQADPRLNIMVDCLAGDNEVAFTDYFYKCKLIYHKLELDYSTCDAASHELTFQYGRTDHARGPASR